MQWKARLLSGQSLARWSATSSQRASARMSRFLPSTAGTTSVTPVFPAVLACVLGTKSQPLWRAHFKMAKRSC